MFTNTRVVVTGSEGFVGSHLRSKLLEEGADVLSMDLSTGIDITNWKQVINYSQSVDIIYHLAARTFIPATSENPRDTYDINLNGTLNMLELGRRNAAKKFVFASAYVYGPPQYLPIDENHPVNPSNPYNRSKLIGEHLCRAYCEDHGMECVILRAFNIYGKGQKGDFLIPSILKQINEQEIQLKDPNPKRDFVYIEDVVEAYLRSSSYTDSAFEVFNIGSGESHSVDEIVRTILDIYGKRITARYLNQQRENEIMDTVADITKAKNKLGWEPRVSLEDGLREYIEH